MKKTALFLHYGPGGNSQVETKWLGEAHPEVDFWDQPKISSQPPTFKGLYTACREKVLSLAADGLPIHLIGHSFGCDLALALYADIPEKVSHVTLISPVRNLISAFIRLGQILAPAATAKLQRAQETSAQPQQILDEAWVLIGEVLKSPRFAATYWQDQKAFQKFIQINSQCTPLDFTMWQSILSDIYLHGTQPPIPAFDKNLTVILGTHDPYFDVNEERMFWSTKTTVKNLLVLEGAGHHPHLEKNTLG